MQKITLEINNSIYDYIMFFLENIPKNLVDIQSSNKTSILPKPSTKAFGLLKGKIKDPVQWQREIREESDRNIYGSFEK